MSEKKYIEHPYIKDEAIEARMYQQTIFASSLKGNTLAVLPTGLGKTIILALLIARRLEIYPTDSILVIAPTKPLVEQHVQTFREVFDIMEEEIIMLSGNTSPNKREELWKQGQIIVATPQIVENDLLTGGLDFTHFSLLGVDEAHRAVGNYAYVPVAKTYMKKAKHPLIFAITASPGSDKEKIEEICQNLFIENIETRTDRSRDVKPYVQKTEVEWIHVELPKKFQRIKTLLQNSLSSKLKQLKHLGWLESASVQISRRDLIRLPKQITKEFDRRGNDPDLYLALGLVGSSIRLTHALELLETQGISSLLKYFHKMRKEAKGRKASKNLISLVKEDGMIVAYDIAQQIKKEGIEHPKIPKLLEIVTETINQSPDSRVLVFTQYRNSAKKLAEILNELEPLKVSRFVGQASKADDKGFSQKEQLEIMQKFREGILNCLVATSVGEEGLDVSECDLVVFYDCVPSAVRSIQRRGRTGRKREGRVIVLIAKGTRDEGYFWASKHKERKMRKNLRELEKYKDAIDVRQKSIEDFFGQQATSSEQRESVAEESQPFTDDPLINDEALARMEAQVKAAEKGETVELSTTEQKLKDDFPTEMELESTTEESKIKIIVDSRETKSGIARELADLTVDIEIETLSVADFILSSRVGVERKDAADFTDSIIDGRLFPQLIALKRNYELPILIIEGETIYGHRAINPEALRGAIASIIINFDIKIIWTRHIKDTARYLKTIARKEQEYVDRTPVIRTEKAPIETSELQEFIVAGFPDINAVLAKRLMTKFQTIENFVNAPMDELKAIKGIGAKKAKQIKELIKAQYDSKT
ncbi:MAG: DEAD/DEAH box helicase [Candidatus Heimdallarchaeota archaeon]|nr:DEAD/DEAH box helicase [Candidatus Heimdallarchaeota archaeon]